MRTTSTLKGDMTMAEREPTDVRNLNRYGSPALQWSRARDILAVPSQTDRFFLGTVGPDGRPHAAGVGALWCDGDLYVVSGPGTRKSRNLAANPAGQRVAFDVERRDVRAGAHVRARPHAPQRHDGVGAEVVVGGAQEVAHRREERAPDARGCARGSSRKGTASSATGSASLTAGC